MLTDWNLTPAETFTSKKYFNIEKISSFLPYAEKPATTYFIWIFQTNKTSNNILLVCFTNFTSKMMEIFS